MGWIPFSSSSSIKENTKGRKTSKWMGVLAVLGLAMLPALGNFSGGLLALSGVS